MNQNFQPQGDLLFLEASLGLGQRLKGSFILCSWANSTVNLKMNCLFLSSQLGNKPTSYPLAAVRKLLSVAIFFF